MRKISIIILGIVLIILITSCERGPGSGISLVITSLKADPSRIIPRGTSTLSVEAQGSGTLRYKWSVQEGTLSSTTEKSVIYKAGDKTGTFKITIEVSDAKSTVSRSINIEVVNNGAPVIKSITVSTDHSLFAEDAPEAIAALYSNIHISAKVEDPEGDPLTYKWNVQGDGWGELLLTEGSKATYGTPTADGEYEIKLEVNDGWGRTPISYTKKVNVIWADPATNKLVFHRSKERSDPFGNREIYLMYPDGSHQICVTPHTSSEFWMDDYVTWSPDGKQLVFASNRDFPSSQWRDDRKSDIYKVKVDGTGLTRLTNDSYYTDNDEPAWSPDGTKITFQRGRGLGTRYDIWVMDADDGSNPANLTSNVNGSNWAVSWSFDGTKLAFVSEVGTKMDICVMNADGTGFAKLTSSGDAVDPAWTPEGRISYVRVVQDRGIYIMNADGSNKTRLTWSGRDYDPDWSPDGDKFAFDYIPCQQNDKNCKEIYILSSDGDDQDRAKRSRITYNSMADDNPAWSPK